MTFQNLFFASCCLIAAACSPTKPQALATDRMEFAFQTVSLKSDVMTQLVLDRGVMRREDAARCGVAERWQFYAIRAHERHSTAEDVDAQERADARQRLNAVRREMWSRPFNFLTIFMGTEPEEAVRAAMRADIEHATFGSARLEGVSVDMLHAKAREVLDDCTLRILEKLEGTPVGALVPDEATDRAAFGLTVWRATTRVMTQLAIDRDLLTLEASTRCAAAEGWETIAGRRLMRSVQRGDVPPESLDVLTAEMRLRPFLFERFLQAYVPDPAARRGLLADRAQDAFGVRDANKVRDGVLMPEMQAVLDDCTADLLEKLSRAE
jgi:hypothetical protein